MTRHIVLTLAIAASLAVLAACGNSAPQGPQQPAPAASSVGPLTGLINHAMDKASSAVASHNIKLSSRHGNAPKAEITPAGDLLIAGKPVALSAAQKKELLAYRQQMVEFALEGIDLGKQGATLGLDAAGDALAGIFSGKSTPQVEAQAKARAEQMRVAANQLCQHLPAIMHSQQQLAANLPAFAPYADMTQADINDCHGKAGNNED